jgi:hypothetical protein
MKNTNYTLKLMLLLFCEDLHTVTDEQKLIILLQHTFERCKSSEKHMKEVTRILEEQEEKGRGVYIF